MDILYYYIHAFLQKDINKFNYKWTIDKMLLLEIMVIALSNLLICF